MTSSDTAFAFSVAVLTCVQYGMILWRKHNARMRKKSQKLWEAQLAQLRSVEDRMKGELCPPFEYLDLPSVRLAELLAVPRDEPSEPQRPPSG